MENITAWLELAGAITWLVAAIVEIFVRRHEHRQMMRLLKEKLP